MTFDRLFRQSLLYLTLVLLILGLFFRTANLGEKIFWVDEVSTTLRVSGYTRGEVTAKLLEKQSFTIGTLQQYQQVTHDRPLSETIAALQTSPEHAPLYFVITRLWLNLWGSSAVTIRSLSVVFSLLSILALYYLCRELFLSPQVGNIAISLMAISPFYVAYAQEARPYSLWILLILLSSIAFLRAFKYDRLFDWFLYLISSISILYTSLLSIFAIVAQGIYITTLERFKFSKRLISWSIVVLLTIIAFYPWLLVIAENWSKLESNTTWMRESTSPFEILVVWFYSIAIIFVESPLYLRLDILIIVRLIADFSLFIITGIAFYRLWQKQEKLAFIFLLSLTLVTPIVLSSIDLIFSGQTSATSRYLIPSQLGILLAISHLFATKIFTNYKSTIIWQIIFICLLTVSISSCIYTLDRSPTYQKDQNTNNIAISRIIDRSKTPIIITSSENVLDLISLSYSLKPNVKINLVDRDDRILERLDRLKTSEYALFLLNPPFSALKDIERLPNWQMQEIDRPFSYDLDKTYLSVWQVRYLP
jgi:uncharacterized membrane protein